MKKGREPVRRTEEPEGWKAADVMGSSGKWIFCRRAFSVPSIYGLHGLARYQREGATREDVLGINVIDDQL
jgi:hypothetical protein